jgi:hypothetical protein
LAGGPVTFPALVAAAFTEKKKRATSHYTQRCERPNSQSEPIEPKLLPHYAFSATLQFVPHISKTRRNVSNVLSGKAWKNLAIESQGSVASTL